MNDEKGDLASALYNFRTSIERVSAAFRRHGLQFSQSITLGAVYQSIREDLVEVKLENIDDVIIDKHIFGVNPLKELIETYRKEYAPYLKREHEDVPKKDGFSAEDDIQSAVDSLIYSVDQIFLALMRYKGALENHRRSTKASEKPRIDVASIRRYTDMMSVRLINNKLTYRSDDNQEGHHEKYELFLIVKNNVDLLDRVAVDWNVSENIVVSIERLINIYKADFASFNPLIAGANAEILHFKVKEISLAAPESAFEALMLALVTQDVLLNRYEEWRSINSGLLSRYGQVDIVEGIRLVNAASHAMQHSSKVFDPGLAKGVTVTGIQFKDLEKRDVGNIVPKKILIDQINAIVAKVYEISLRIANQYGGRIKDDAGKVISKEIATYIVTNLKIWIEVFIGEIVKDSGYAFRSVRDIGYYVIEQVTKILD